MAVTVDDLVVELALQTTALNIPDAMRTRLDRILHFSVTTCDRYAPNSPGAARDMAVIRLCDWLYNYNLPGQSSQGQNPLRQSGAQAMLSAYREQRAQNVTPNDQQEGSTPSPGGGRPVYTRVDGNSDWNGAAWRTGFATAFMNPSYYKIIVRVPGDQGFQEHAVTLDAYGTTASARWTSLGVSANVFTFEGPVDDRLRVVVTRAGTVANPSVSCTVTRAGNWTGNGSQTNNEAYAWGVS